MKRLALAAAALLAVASLAACGDDSSSSSSGVATTSVTTAGSGGSSDTTAAAPDSTDATSDTTVDTNFSGSGSKALCSYAKELTKDDFFNGSNATNQTPDQLKQDFQKTQDAVDKMVSKAPGEIKTDLQNMQTYLKSFKDILAKADWDFTKLATSAAQNPDQFKDFEAKSQEFGTSASRVDAYFSKVCGIDTTGGSDTSTTTG